jgi:PAS domain-containing protein
MWDATGGIVSLMDMSRDMTSLKTAEATLQQAHAELAQRVVDRTAELQRSNTTLQREIAARTQTEDALRQSEERCRTLIEGSIQGMTISRQGKFVYANGALAHLLGYDKAADLIGKSARAHVAPHEVDRLRDDFNARQRGEPDPACDAFQAVKKDEC